MLGLSLEQWSYAMGIGIGGVFAILLLGALLSSAILGGAGNRVQRLWVVVLTGGVGIGLYSFGDGEGGFISRITNIPEVETVVGYSISTLIVGALLVWWSRNSPQQPSQFGAGRIVAILISAPLIFLGLGNLAGSAYTAATIGIPGPGWGVSKAEMRDIMLNGDMAPFWRVVDDRAPAEMDAVIDRLFAQEQAFRSEEEARQILNREVANFRVGLATYGPAMTDEQRKELLQANLAFLRRFEDRRELCVAVAMTGGQSLSQEELLLAADEFNEMSVVMTESLLAAKEAASQGATLPKPPTEEDYGQLVDVLVAAGVSDGALRAIINGDAAHPEFCSGSIAFVEAVVALEGSAGEAVRFEVAQSMLTAAY